MYDKPPPCNNTKPLDPCQRLLTFASAVAEHVTAIATWLRYGGNRYANQTFPWFRIGFAIYIGNLDVDNANT